MVFWKHIGSISKRKSKLEPKVQNEAPTSHVGKVRRNSARLDRAGRTPSYVYLYRAHVSGTLALHHSCACNTPFRCVHHTALVLITHRSGACSTPLWCI